MKNEVPQLTKYPVIYQQCWSLGRLVMRALELVSVRVQSVRGEYKERVNQYTTARHGDIPWGKP